MTQSKFVVMMVVDRAAPKNMKRRKEDLDGSLILHDAWVPEVVLVTASEKKVCAHIDKFIESELTACMECDYIREDYVISRRKVGSTEVVGRTGDVVFEWDAPPIKRMELKKGRVDGKRVCKGEQYHCRLDSNDGFTSHRLMWYDHGPALGEVYRYHNWYIEEFPPDDEYLTTGNAKRAWRVVTETDAYTPDGYAFLIVEI